MNRRLTFCARLFLIGVAWKPLFVSAQTPIFYDTTATITSRFTIQNQVGLTEVILNNTDNTENKQLKEAANALIQTTVDLPDATNITYPQIVAVTNVTCPGTLNLPGSICHQVSMTFTILYNASAFTTPPGSGVASTFSAAVNAGYLSCRLAQLYPASNIRLRTGVACPETSIPPAQVPTRAPFEPFTIATVSNSFFIYNNAGITASTLNTDGNEQKRQILSAFITLLNETIEDIVAQGATLTENRTLSVADTTCPTGLNGTCHIATVTYHLEYQASSFVGQNPPNIISSRMQNSVNGGLLICEHQRLYPNALVVVRSGNRCPTDTRAPTSKPSTAPTVLANRFDSSAAITVNFGTLHNSSVSMFMSPSNPSRIELLAAVNSIITARLENFTAMAQGPLQYGAAVFGTISLVPCPQPAPAMSQCHNVAVTFALNYSSSDFTIPPATPVANLVQDTINKGDLDCELERLFPASLVQVTTGGGCPASRPTRYDASATIQSFFVISNNNSITASMFLEPNNPQKAELTAAYNALLSDALKTFFASGAVLDGAAIIGTFTPDSSCRIGATCHVVMGSFKLNYNRVNFPAGQTGQLALNQVDAAIASGLLICYHNTLSPGSIVTIVTGGSCNSSGILDLTSRPTSPISVATVPPTMSPTVTAATIPPTLSPIITVVTVTPTLSPTVAAVTVPPTLSPAISVATGSPTTLSPLSLGAPTGFPSTSLNPSAEPSTGAVGLPANTVVPTLTAPISAPPTFRAPSTLPSSSLIPSSEPSAGSKAPVAKTVVPTLSPVTPVPPNIAAPSTFPSSSQSPSSFPSAGSQSPSYILLSRRTNVPTMTNPVSAAPVASGITTRCDDLEDCPFFVNVDIGKQTCSWLRSTNATADQLSTICSSGNPLGYGFVVCPRTCGRCTNLGF